MGAQLATNCCEI